MNSSDYIRLKHLLEGDLDIDDPITFVTIARKFLNEYLEVLKDKELNTNER